VIIPAVYKVKMFGGDNWDLSLNWKDANGNLFNLTGYSGILRFFKSKTDRTVVTTLTDTNGGITLGNGSASPNIQAKLSKTLTTFATPPGYFVLELTQPDGTEIRLLEGGVKYEA
jgi:hypothetical protein